MTNKLNSMRVLEANKVAYNIFTYDEEIHDAVQVAAVIGIPVNQVYKTLVVERSAGRKPVLVMIAADKQLDLKKLAASVGEKKVSMASHADAERLTGLKVGGIGALALIQKNWSVYLDQPVEKLSHICVSAGQRGTNLRVPVADLVRVLKAKIVQASSAD